MDGPDESPAKLVCKACRRTIDCPPADLARHMRAGDWPRCCDHVMAFYVPTGKPWEPPPSTTFGRILADR